MALRDDISNLESLIHNPRKGLPEEVFLFVSRITPLVNVDLLIKNAANETLLTWRDEGDYSPGWHIPGGIIRFKETIAGRIAAVARQELGTDVECDPAPTAIHEIIHSERKDRGHFISLLFRCYLVSRLDATLHYDGVTPRPGVWMWHRACPDNLIAGHDIYRKYI